MMPLFPVFHVPITAALASALLASLWQGSVLVLLVSLGLRLLPGLTAAARASIWAAVLLVIAVHPVLAFLGRGSAAAGASGTGLLHAEFGFSVALVAVWGLASLFRLFQLAISGVELWRTLRSAQPLGVPPAVAALLRESRREPELCASTTVNRPCVAGFFRPRLLLPADLLPGLKESELTQIVLHELEHLRRGDDWVNLLQQVALVVLPLHPAMFWVNRQVALERELACDDAVLATTRAGKAYAACLAHVAEQSLRRRGLRRGLSLAVGALGSWRRRPELTARVERILRRPERALSGMRLRLATGVVLAGTVFAGGALERSPTLVSFGPGARLAMAVGANSANSANSANRFMAGVQVVPASFKPALTGFAREDRAPGVRGGVPSAVLLQAVMPVSGVAAEAKSSEGRLHPAAVRRVRRATAVRAGLRRSGRVETAPWLMLTAWQAGVADSAETAPRRVPVVYAPRLQRVVVVDAQQVWYTAVRVVETPNGWLVVQL